MLFRHFFFNYDVLWCQHLAENKLFFVFFCKIEEVFLLVYLTSAPWPACARAPCWKFGNYAWVAMTKPNPDIVIGPEFVTSSLLRPTSHNPIPGLNHSGPLYYPTTIKTPLIYRIYNYWAMKNSYNIFLQ